MKFSENLNLPILQDGDKYSKEIQNEAFNTIDKECTNINNTIKSILDINDDVTDAIKTLGDISEELSDLKEKQNEDYYELLESNNYIGEKIKDINSQLDNITNYLTPKMFGAKADGITDDTNAIIQCFENAKIKKTNILFDGEKYLITSKINIVDLHSIIIDFNNALILLSDTFAKNTNRDVFSFTNLDGCSINVLNLYIDGIATKQDQFSETDSTKVEILTGLTVFSNYPTVSNINIKNLYGSAMRFRKVKNANISNIIVNNVGGKWYLNNSYDMFGDFISFSTFENDSVINIKDVIANAKTSGSINSRIGICFDNGTLQGNGNKCTINADNIVLNNYNRVFHIENGDNVKLNINKADCIGDLLCYEYDCNTLTKFNLFNVSYTSTQQSFNSALGISKGGEINAVNCLFDLRNTTSKASGNTGTVISYDNCIIKANEFFNLLGSSGEIKNSEIQFYKLPLTSILSGTGSLYFRKCKFKNLLDDLLMTLPSGGTKWNVEDCIYENVYTNYCTFNGNNKGYYSVDTTTLSKTAKMEIYENGILKRNNLLSYAYIDTTSSRPTVVSKGCFMFDDTLKKMIVYNGTAWTTFDGTVV